MSFLEHLDELRQRLVRSAVGLCVGFGLCWGFREKIFHFMTAPLRTAGFKDQFIYTSPADALMLYMQMAFFLGIFVVSPYLLWEVWGFISPGLYKNEKIYVVPFIVFGSLFFVGGAAFGHFYLFPQTFSFLGVQFAAPVIGSVRITSGNAALAAGVTDGTTTDVVAMDDFLYSEPISASAPEPGAFALALSALLPVGGFALRRRRAA